MLFFFQLLLNLFRSQPSSLFRRYLRHSCSYLFLGTVRWRSCCSSRRCGRLWRNRSSVCLEEGNRWSRRLDELFLVLRPVCLALLFWRGSFCLEFGIAPCWPLTAASLLQVFLCRRCLVFHFGRFDPCVRFLNIGLLVSSRLSPRLDLRSRECEPVYPRTLLTGFVCPETLQRVGRSAPHRPASFPMLSKTIPSCGSASSGTPSSYSCSKLKRYAPQMVSHHLHAPLSSGSLGHHQLLSPCLALYFQPCPFWSETNDWNWPPATLSFLLNQCPPVWACAN